MYIIMTEFSYEHDVKVSSCTRLGAHFDFTTQKGLKINKNGDECNKNDKRIEKRKQD